MPLVAVVEDDPDSQNTLARLLRAGGYDAALYASKAAGRNRTTVAIS